MKIGDEVKFRDGNATGYNICVGIVNGEPATIGDTTFIPVWTERKGREATTIGVNINNIIKED